MSKLWVLNAELVWKIAIHYGWSHKTIVENAPLLFADWNNAIQQLDMGINIPPFIQKAKYMARLFKLQKILRFYHYIETILLNGTKEIILLESFFAKQIKLQHFEIYKTPFLVSNDLFLAWFHRYALAQPRSPLILSYNTFQNKSVWETLPVEKFLKTKSVQKAIIYATLPEKNFPYKLLLLSRKFNIHYHATRSIASTFLNTVQQTLQPL